jgi:hypothetical protein
MFYESITFMQSLDRLVTFASNEQPQIVASLEEQDIEDDIDYSNSEDELRLQ